MSLDSPDTDHALVTDAPTSAVMAALEGVTLSQDEIEATAGGDGDPAVEGNSSNAGSGSVQHILGGRKGQAIAEALSAAEEIAAEMGADDPTMISDQQEGEEEA